MLMNLPDFLRARLLERRGEWLSIAKEAEVSHSWISKFVNNHIPNPGYATLERLHRCLQGDVAVADSEQNQPPTPAHQAQAAINSDVQEVGHA